MPSSGELLGDRYRLEEPIATGGMGEVWQATDIVLGRGVAVKVLHGPRAGDPEFKTRFGREARTMAALHHPGVVEVYDYGETGDGASAYVVMARIDGQPLDARIAEAGRLEPAETMSIVAQTARALHAAHTAGIVHRDVKPGNLIVQPDGTVVLVDFGVAQSADSATLTGANEVVGTAFYIAPEQVSKQPTGPAADVYALGAVAFHCLAGHPPFLGPNPVTVAIQHLNEEPPALPADVPAAVRDLVATAMRKSPAERPSAAAMADAAQTLATQTGTTGQAGTVVAPIAGGAEPHPRHRATVWALALLALITTGAVLFFTGPAPVLEGPLHPAPPPGSAPASSAGADREPGAAVTGLPASAGQPSATPAPPADHPALPGATPNTPGGSAGGPASSAPGPGPTTPGGQTTGPTQSAAGDPNATATNGQPAATAPSTPTG